MFIEPLILPAGSCGLMREAVECAGTDVQLEQAVFKQLEIALRGCGCLPGGDVDGVEHQFPLSVCGVACNGEAAVRARRADAELPRDFGRGGRATDADAAVQPALNAVCSTSSAPTELMPIFKSRMSFSVSILPDSLMPPRPSRAADVLPICTVPSCR